MYTPRVVFSNISRCFLRPRSIRADLDAGWKASSRRRLLVGASIILLLAGLASAATAGTCVDNDGDGYGYPDSGSCEFVGSDCDDNAFFVNPGEIELCGDTIDNNCDGQIDLECVACCVPARFGCTVDVTLDNVDLVSAETIEVCNTITLGPNFTIGKTGSVRLRAGISVIFVGPVTVDEFGELVVAIDASLPAP